MYVFVITHVTIIRYLLTYLLIVNMASIEVLITF